MRALCGAIITAGALIGLGLTALGIGTRYTMERATTSDGQPPLVRLSQMDRPLIFILVFLTSAALVGLAIAFVGLAYHQLRRDREHLWEREHAPAQPRTPV
jgi:F0F1-type ATP synthase membrane subunit c/vacuolar-type H+-ATPase subunit K